MKKLFALILALCMLCGCTALADNEISWEQVAPMLEAAGVTGEFHTFDEIAVKVFVPDGMVAAELPDENYIGYFTDEAGTSAIAVLYVNVEGMDLDAYAEALANQFGAAAEKGTVNGLPCVTYEIAENKTMNIAFTTEAGYILEVVVGPIEDDASRTGGSIVLASVQAAE